MDPSKPAGDREAQLLQRRHEMDGQIVVGAGKAVRDLRQGLQLTQEPGGIPVVFPVLRQDAQVLPDGKPSLPQRHAAAHPALIKAVAVFYTPHKPDLLCSCRDHSPHKCRFTGQILHGDEVAVNGTAGGSGVAVHKHGGLSQGADALQVGPVKQLDTQDPRGLLQVQVGRKALFPDL